MSVVKHVKHVHGTNAGDMDDMGWYGWFLWLCLFSRLNRFPMVPRCFHHQISKFIGSASVNSLLGQDDVALVDLAFASRCGDVFELAKWFNYWTYMYTSSQKGATLHISVSKCCEMSWVMAWHCKNQVRQWWSRAWALHIHPRNTSRATDLSLSGTACANQEEDMRNWDIIQELRQE